MLVELLVLSAVLLSMIAVVVAFVPPRRAPAPDENAIESAPQLDAAMGRQRSRRIATLRLRMRHNHFWPYALLGLALLMQVAALVADHLTHPSIGAIWLIPAFFVVLAGRTARRREVQSQLDGLVAESNRRRSRT